MANQGKPSTLSARGTARRVAVIEFRGRGKCGGAGNDQGGRAWDRKNGERDRQPLVTGRLELSLWDRTKSKPEALKLGRVADSPADAIRQAEVVISMVAGPQALRQVSLGPDGVFAAAAGKTIVDLSTAGPGMGGATFKH